MKPEPLLLQAEGLRLAFGGRAVLDGVDLAVSGGEVLAVVGKSGAGKSVLLKTLAGVLSPDAGTLRFGGIPLDQAHRETRVELRRRCSYLFQGNALFDSLTAAANVALPLEQATSLSDREIRWRVCEALGRFELADCADRFPAQLSGGQQKRLALARALVTDPELVLFDEPTAGLDPLRRNAVFTMIVRAKRQFGFTAVVVTHDVPEALATCDRLALLDGGRICFDGSPGQFAASSQPTVVQFRESANAMAWEIAAMRQDSTNLNLPDLA